MQLWDFEKEAEYFVYLKRWDFLVRPFSTTGLESSTYLAAERTSLLHPFKRPVTGAEVKGCPEAPREGAVLAERRRETGSCPYF